MSADEFLLDDYLVAIAEGIHHAQHQLDRLQGPGQPGQPPVTYYLPKVDFELKLVVATSGSLGAPNTAVPGPAGQPRKQLFFQPARPDGATSAQARSESTSVIRGSFIAVPANGGKPPTVLRVGAARKGGAASREVEITVEVRNAIGERLADVEVEFNLDPDLSRRLSQPGIADLKLAADTNVLYGVRRTGADGVAKNVLRIGAAEPPGAVIAVIVDALGQTETLTARAGG